MKRKVISIGALMLVLALLITMAPACGNGDDEEPTPGFTPVPGVTPTPGATPTPTPEAKTVKFGVLTYLSGAAAAWGIPQEEGMKWAAEVINERGGIKVGDDVYMVEVVSEDGGLSPSTQVEAASRLTDLEHVHYITHLGQIEAVMPILDAGKCFSMTLNASRRAINPEFPYSINGVTDYKNWLRGFYTMAKEHNPGVKTAVVINADDVNGHENMQYSIDQLPEFGIEVLGHDYFTSGTTDFYPILTKLLAKNPDVVDYSGMAPGDVALCTKQALELGFEGQFWNPAHSPLATLKAVIGGSADEINGRYRTNEPDYSSDVYPVAVHEIYADFNERFPEHNGVMNLLHYLAYAHGMFYAQAIEKAQSVDPEDLHAVFDDPTWRFDWFGQEASMGGVETGGIRRAVNAYVTYSEIIDGKVVTKDTFFVVVP